MQIEVYNMAADESNLTITLEAVCDSFSSLLWDIEYYQCGSFEVYIAANPENLSIFQSGRIVGRDDDSRHFGIIESVQIDTDAENGDYLTVKGRFLMCLLERRIINPTLSITADTAYSNIVRNAVTLNAIQLLPIPLSLETLPTSMAMARVRNESTQHIVLVLSRHILTDTSCMWTQRISPRRNRSRVKQCLFPKRSISSC